MSAMQVTVRLKGEEIKKFFKVKEKTGLRSNAEVIRALIEKASRLEAIV